MMGFSKECALVAPADNAMLLERATCLRPEDLGRDKRLGLVMKGTRKLTRVDCEVTRVVEQSMTSTHLLHFEYFARNTIIDN
jgi:hypothetical protein